jgi:mono/diheme cytochrome c family protein
MRFAFPLSSAVAVAVSVGVWSQDAAAQRPVTPPFVISSLSGGDLFQFYCATCHGHAGKGDGPVVQSLKKQPPDLTTIAARNGGHFPSEALLRFVAGDDRLVDAHGSREMPVWGPIFQSLEPHDRLTRIRIENVVAFIESLQKP